MSEPELIIDATNFEQHFFDARRHTPQRGQVMAAYTAIAEMVDSPEKANLVDLLLKYDNKVEAAIQVMRKLICATDKDSVRVLREIMEDLRDGMTKEEVLAKPYKFTMRMIFYTQRENVPVDDPHWDIIEMIRPEKGVNVNGFNIKLVEDNSRKEP